MKRLVLVCFIGFVLVFVGLIGFVFFRYLGRPASVDTTAIVYEVRPGSTLARTAQDLQDRGLLTNTKFFLLYARILGQSSKLKVGEYELSPSQTPMEILSSLTSGRSIERFLTISEGLNIYEIAGLFKNSGIVGASDFLKLVKDPKLVKSLLGESYVSLEGYLYPETYSYTKFTDARVLIEKMVQRFNIVYQDVLSEHGGHSILNKHQVVTLASIVEKETGVPDERPLIASVFFNRLQKRMLLQTDPTVIYGIADLTGKIPFNIRKSDLQKATRYNTYVIKGLPPGPIANPGKEALSAVFKPAQSDYLYFVSQNDGTHIFSRDYESHHQAVRRYQMDPRARAGKSWRKQPAGERP